MLSVLLAVADTVPKGLTRERKQCAVKQDKVTKIQRTDAQIVRRDAAPKNIRNGCQCPGESFKSGLDKG